jgi:hypothetical protein
MTKLKLLLCAGSAALGLACAGTAFADTPAAAAPAAPAPSPAPYPAMTAPLAANPNPASFDAGPLGKLTVDGVLSGAGLWQSNPQFGAFGPTHDGYAELTNAQVIINKTDGPVQFYIQAGAYTIPALGAAFYKPEQLDSNTFGYVPQGFIKFVPTGEISIEVGALPTLIGSEYTFSFENMNIERGLLWGQEPAVSKGIQVNYSKGPIAISGAVTDGYDSDTYTALSGLITYTFKNSDTLAFAAEGNVGKSKVSTFVTPPQQNNGMIFNIMYSHTMGPLTISPYFQYNNSPNIPGVSSSGDSWGLAVLAKYTFTPEVSLAGRVEYIASSGPANLLGYGTKSDAWSITVTPTWQKGIYFVRGELSYVGIGSGTKGLMFGLSGNADNQTRALVEAGVMF